MQMYKEAEEMTQKIEAAYALVSSWLASSRDNPSDGPIVI
jgi:hypothetical protein